MLSDLRVRFFISRFHAIKDRCFYTVSADSGLQSALTVSAALAAGPLSARQI